MRSEAEIARSDDHSGTDIDGVFPSAGAVAGGGVGFAAGVTELSGPPQPTMPNPNTSIATANSFFMKSFLR